MKYINALYSAFWIVTVLTLVAWLIVVYLHLGWKIDPFFWQYPAIGNGLQVVLIILVKIMESKTKKQ